MKMEHTLKSARTLRMRTTAQHSDGRVEHLAVLAEVFCTRDDAWVVNIKKICRTDQQIERSQHAIKAALRSRPAYMPEPAVIQKLTQYILQNIQAGCPSSI